MKNENKKSSEFATLRQKAEELLNNKIPKAAFGNSEAKVHKLIHELEVHQIELELQNEELMLAKESEKSTAEKYIALYDFSPSGYFTLSPEGNISELNLTGSVLLGKDRSYLKNKRFSLFISEDSKSTFNRFIQKVFESNSKESCEIAVLRQDESQRYIHISGIAVENGEQCLLTLVDMTEQKLTEQKLHKSEELLNEFKLHKSEEFSKRVIESSNDSIKVLDLQGNLIYMSNGGQTLLEIDDISIYLNKSWVDLWKGDDNKAAAEAVSKAASGYATLFNGYCKTEKGTPKWWEIIVSPIKDTDGDVINLLAISRDVTERKQAEEKLKTSMEREKEFADIVRKAPLAMAFGYPDGRLANCNSAFSALTGYTILELQQINWNDVLTPSQWKSSEGKQLSQLSPSKKNVKYEKEYIHKDGHSVPIELTVSAKFDSAGNLLHYVGFAIDITDRKLAEKELKESEERFRNAITYAPYPIMIHADGEVLQLSKEWIKQTGYTIDDIPTIKKWTLKAYGKDAVLGQEFIDDLYKIEKPQYDGEWQVKIEDGSYRLWDFSSSPIGKLPNGKKMVISMASDITERKLAEEKTRAAEQNLQNTFDISPSIIAKINLDTGYFIEVNQAVTRILGYTVEEFTSRPCMEFIHPDHRQQSVSEVTQQLGGMDVAFFENQYLCKDGSYKWMAWNATKADENGIETAIGSNINKRKNTEIKLKIALDKALESDRLKSAFLANMSHEIRTPMNGIRGFISLLKEPNLSHDEINTYSNIIDKSSDRLLNTINDIIDIAKIEAGEMLVSKDETFVNSIMDELYSFYSPEAKLKGLSLLLKPATEQLTIITDSHKLYGTLSNLIKNAIKYTDKGSITFGYALSKNAKSIVNKQDRSSEVEFFVEDTGIGIPKERLQAIFNRFEQADIEDKKAHEGSGLGLAISKAYIEMLGGKIFVESDTGKGSKFTFIIPHNKINKGGNMNIYKTTDNKTLKLENLNILVVEDDEVSSIFFKTMLEGIFQNFILAKNGIEAVQLCKNGSEVDLVLMDIKMPVMDGYDATREIRKFNKDLVIIAQTAYALHGDKEKAIEAGCNDYITKPINKTLLLEMISKHVGEQQSMYLNDQL